MLLKGSLGNEDLLSPVSASASGLRGPRRLSHAHFLDPAGWPNGILLADAQRNITPNLAADSALSEDAAGANGRPVRGGGPG